MQIRSSSRLAQAVSRPSYLLCSGLGALLLGCSAGAEGADGAPVFGGGGSPVAAAGAPGLGAPVAAGGNRGSNEGVPPVTGGLGAAGNAPVGMNGTGGTPATGAGGAPIGTAG